MDFVAIAVTVLAGVVMGAINNLAGGAGIVGLMAFEYACGLPLAVANPSLRLAGLCVGLALHGIVAPRCRWRQLRAARDR